MTKAIKTSKAAATEIKRLKKKLKTVEKRKKETTKPITFRVDSDLLNRIKKLERVKNSTTSTVIKESIEQSHNNIIFNNANKHLFDIFKKVFGKIKSVTPIVLEMQVMDIDAGIDLERENPFDVNNMTAVTKNRMFYVLDLDNYKSKELDTSLNFDTYSTELKFEMGNNLKLKMKKPIFISNLNKMNKKLYFEILSKISDPDYLIETHTIEGNKNYVSIVFERFISIKPDIWIKRFEKELIKMKSVMDKLERIIKNNKNFNKE